MKLTTFIGKLFRKKVFDAVSVKETNLKRVLNLFDVTCIGVSCTIAGVYILLGDVVANNAGPATIVSFIIAGISTYLAAMCYAELGARVPRAGSAYTYIYVTIGEFVAFILGWDLILEYVIGIASIASSLSQHVDFLFDNKIHNFLNRSIPIHAAGIVESPDILAFLFCIIATILMLLAVKESTRVNVLLTILNIGFLVFAIVLGALKADFSNWSVSSNLTNSSSTNETTTMIMTNHSSSSPVVVCSKQRIGDGGFMPFGINGVVAGAAKCFYAYIGFDSICASGEEVKNPHRTIPLGIILTLLVVTVIFLSMSMVLTTMIPYCLIDTETPLPYAFEYVGFNWAKYIVSAGAIISLIVCLTTGMYPLPRIAYSIANDGLLFKVFKKLVPRFQTPLTATLVFGLLAAFMALLVNLDELIDMISIGTLMAYSCVCVCVLVLRYRPPFVDPNEPTYWRYLIQNNKKTTTTTTNKITSKISIETVSSSATTTEIHKSLIRKFFYPISAECDRKVSNYANFLTFLSILLIITLSLLINFYKRLFGSTGDAFYAVLFVCILLVCLIVFLSTLIWLQPQNNSIETFKAPFLPYSPFLALFMNVYLMLNLSPITLYRVVAWLLLGLLIYLGYGYRHSKENKDRDQNKAEAVKENNEFVELT